MSDNTYNGWANYETWNVALWIQNDPGLCSLAMYCRPSLHPYKDFVESIDRIYEGCPDSPAIAYRTPDGVSWNDSSLDTDELDKMIEEL